MSFLTSLGISVILISIFTANAQEDLLEFDTDPDILEDARLDTFSLIRKYGYRCEIHRVYTEDKYILEMHRIPFGRNNASKGPKPVVFLQHGLLSSSAEWVLMTPGKGLAYILADAGYDVWMGNARGNTYSRHHMTLKPTSSAFWKFSWHEIGYYDLPAMIDYVINEAGVPKIQYVGFSQGTTVFWVLTSSRPEYNDKISAMQALAPVAYVDNIKSPLIRAIAPFTNSMSTILKILGANELLSNGKLNELAGQKLCLEEALTQGLCANLLFLICGFNADQLNANECIKFRRVTSSNNATYSRKIWQRQTTHRTSRDARINCKTMLPVILGHTPAGSSTRQIVHFGQLYKSGKYVNFDYGSLSNKLIYGTFRPPAYNLSAIRTPIFLHYSDNDWLTTPQDVDKLSKEVKSVIGKYRVPLDKFNHLDFVFANDAKKLIYDRLINIMAQFK